MSTNPTATENGIEQSKSTISGPHEAQNAYGEIYHFWRCERCGVETTDESIRFGCFRCGADTEGGR